MAVYDELVRELQADPSRREALRAILLSDELLALPQRLADLTLEVRAFAQEMRAFVQEMRAFAALTNRRLGSVEGDVAQLKSDVAQLKSDVAQLKSDVARLKGSDLERSWREKAYAYLGRHFRRLATLSGAEVSALLDDALEEGRIDIDELVDAANADAIVRGLGAEGREPVYVVVEASWTLASSDVIRARRRAEILQRATGVASVAVAGGSDAPPPVVAQAQVAEVLVFTNGRAAA